MKKTFLIALTLASIKAEAQEPAKSPLTFSGYLETYYSYDLGSPEDHFRPHFFYSYNRHNEVNLNMALAKVNYETDQIRGNFALMAGTYAEYNFPDREDLKKHF